MLSHKALAKKINAFGTLFPISGAKVQQIFNMTNKKWVIFNIFTDIFACFYKKSAQYVQ